MFEHSPGALQIGEYEHNAKRFRQGVNCALQMLAQHLVQKLLLGIASPQHRPLVQLLENRKTLVIQRMLFIRDKLFGERLCLRHSVMKVLVRMRKNPGPEPFCIME